MKFNSFLAINDQMHCHLIEINLSKNEKCHKEGIGCVFAKIHWA